MTTHRTGWAFILVAAGSGSRIGGKPKQFRRLGGSSMWRWSAAVAEELYDLGKIDELIVVLPECEDTLARTEHLRCRTRFVNGGPSRSDSVQNGLLATNADFVMIHDAARPFLDIRICEELIRKTSRDAGAVPLLESVDSLKILKEGVMSAIPREQVFRTQTPQAFDRNKLICAMNAHKSAATDEATIWLTCGYPLNVVKGDARNFKVTTNFDWRVASAIAGEARVTHTGFGFDVHELVPGRKLVLGGVLVESPLGLLGHSDADVVCHAISDALLGAAGEGDIGTLFPASSSAYKDADSTILLEKVLHILLQKKWHIVCLDVTLVAQVPRLASKMPEIAGSLNMLFTKNGVSAKLNLKVKSGEYVGNIGRADSMTCYASATIERYEVNDEEYEN